MTISAKELRAYAQGLIPHLAAHGVTATLIEDSFRDYMVKLDIHKGDTPFGKLLIYHAPKNDTYSAKTHELKGSAIKAEIDTVYSQFNPTVKASASKSTGNKTSTPAAKATGADLDLSKGYFAFVDGSFYSGAIGYGVVILQDGVPQHELSGVCRVTAEDAKSRQVVGEVTAAMEAVKWGVENKVALLNICYDYEGVAKWAKQQWKANLPLTTRYQAFMVETQDNGLIKLRFHKIAAHTGVKWNERADDLARGAAMRA